jgi:hypothetical protein
MGSSPMTDPEVIALRNRIDELERRLRELTARVVYLESRTQPRIENPLDSQAAREKSVYDWQGPR